MLTVPGNDLQLVEPKTLTLAQLKEYDGSDKKKSIYLAIRGIIFDVSKGELYSRRKAYPTSHASIAVARAEQKCSRK